MKKVIVLLLVLVVAAACQPTMKLGFRWDKNTEEDMDHYDLFTLTLSDSAGFFALTTWPADTSVKNVYVDSIIHMPNLLATMAHIYSPIDSMVYEWNKRMEQKYLRGYILAADSSGNTSALAPSINIIYVGDRDGPDIPTQNFVFPRK